MNPIDPEIMNPYIIDEPQTLVGFMSSPRNVVVRASTQWADASHALQGLAAEALNPKP